jgi:hypothetical protein
MFRKILAALAIIAVCAVSAFAQAATIPGATEFGATVTAGKDLFTTVAEILLAILGFTVLYKMAKKLR